MLLNNSSDLRNFFSPTTIGIPILCTLSRKRATVGEIIYVNGVYYGLIAAHLFDVSYSTISNNSTPSECQEGDLEFAFISDEEEEPGEVDISDIAITSQDRISILRDTN
jgi:hypothetical protein